MKQIEEQENNGENNIENDHNDNTKMETENPVSQQNSSGSKHDKTLSPPENSHPKSQEENIREPTNINSSPRNIVRDRNSISRSRSRSKSLSIQRSHHNNSNSNILLLNGKFSNF